MTVEQRHDPVAKRDAQAERGGVEHRQAVQLPVAQDTGAEPFLARGPDAAFVRRRRGEQDEPEQRDRDGGSVRRPPAEEPLDLRDDREREAATREADPAEHALRRR